MKWRWMYILVPLVVLGSLVGWRLTQKQAAAAEEKKSAEARRKAPASVRTATARRQDIVKNFEAVGYSFGDYFPAGSDQGDTRASPKIWQEMAEFQRYITEFRDNAAKGIAAKPETLEAFQAVLGPLGQNCQQCHEEFREEQ